MCLKHLLRNTALRCHLMRQNSLIEEFKNVRYFRKSRNPNNPSHKNIEPPFQNVKNLHLNSGNLVKPLAFTFGFSGVCFLGVSIWEYENMRIKVKMLSKTAKALKKKSDFSLRLTTISDLFKENWNKLSSGEKVFVPICALNIIIFVGWKVPKLQPFMLKYFCSNPGSQNVCLPMLLSTFSHYSGVHLLANMYVLHSFSTGAVQGLGKEQFLGLYLSGGVISSLTSYVYKVFAKQPGLSLGASGSIMTMLGYICTQYPETQLGIILLPILTFSAGSAIKAIVAMDTVGVALGWKFFDHAAHLGGAACGILWALWGNQYIWPQRAVILQHWHKLRGSVK